MRAACTRSNSGTTARRATDDAANTSPKAPACRNSSPPNTAPPTVATAFATLKAVSTGVRSWFSRVSNTSRNMASSYAAHAKPDATLTATSQGTDGEKSHKAGNGTIPSVPSRSAKSAPRRRTRRAKSGKLTIFAQYETANSKTYDP